jgi:FtsP/CotA-like multicopper oxidase with cupredoxin domain
MRVLHRPVAIAAAIVIAAALLPAGTLAARPHAGTASAAHPSRSATLESRARTTSAAPASPAAPVPAIDCSTACDLYATTGEVTLPGQVSPVPIRGFSTSATAGTATLPGPTIVATVGQVLTVHLHNLLDAPVSLAFPGQSLAPDTTGVGINEDATYTFTVSSPGTYLYEAGLTTAGPGLVATGMSGALIVRPAAANTAYEAGTEYDVEATLVLSGIDPAFNANPVDPATFTPSYWVVNGSAFPDNGAIKVGPGNRLLLRVINAGLNEESVSVSGLRQVVIAVDAARRPLSNIVAQTLPPGATMDSMVDVPVGPNGTRYLLLSAAGHLFDGSSSDATVPSGGFIQVIEIDDTLPPAVHTPLATIAPATTTLHLTTTATDAGTGGSAIAGGEWFAGTDPGTGAGHPMSVEATGSTTATLGATVNIASWTAGGHTIGVRARDAAGNWSTTATTTVSVARTLFADGFETGLSRWTSVSGGSRLSVGTAARISGRRGLRVTLSGSRTAFVTDATPENLARYRARFELRPNRANAKGTTDVFVGRDATSHSLFRVQYRRTTSGRLQVRAAALSGSRTIAGSWYTISNRAHRLELVWYARSGTVMALYVDGHLRSKVTGNSTGRRLESVSLGVVRAAPGSSGRIDVDGFSSTRGESFAR